MSNILKVVFVIIGTMIGAGFASGQEVYLFFYSHGIEGLFGILISCILFGLVIYKTFNISNKYDINNYKKFLDILINKNQEIKPIINTVINIFTLITFFIMIAGFGAYCEQELGLNNLIGSSILAIIAFIVFLTSIKGVVKANEIMVPLLISFLIIIGIITFKEVDFSNFQNHLINTNKSNFIINAILYCSYNSILLIPVLLTLRSYIKNNKQILKISIISTTILLILSLIIFIILTKVDTDISKLEMPAVYVVSKISTFFKYIYGFIIMGSIFTTTITLGNSFLQNTTKNKKNYTQLAIIMCITSVLISNIGFSKLVSLLYPIFGYLGAVQIVKIMSS